MWGADADRLLAKALNEEWLTPQEALYLFERVSTGELMAAADELRRRKKHPHEHIVTWIIDRNVNITNVCVAVCKFCNFFRPPGHPEGYITTMEEYEQKITELFEKGGDQLLLQGGHHPHLGLAFYESLFRELKARFPRLKLHALSPPEIVHIARLENKPYEYVLERLVRAGLDSLPGAGAEILVDRVRKKISRGKCTAGEWLAVMRAAHRLGLVTTATMMFGHVETPLERMLHLAKIRQLQAEKPRGAVGFIAFIPWPFQSEGTTLARLHNGRRWGCSGDEYVRMIAISRLMLPNIENIQASWLTVGRQVAQLCLHAGANDMGSIMIEENVVSAAGAHHRMDAHQIQEAIREAGFVPRRRNQRYEFVE